ncbi:MAG TPA: helix-hairpin-helix domain-containing protein [Flavisolibacter sp.]|jgi:competence protein ComEA|nr:helix-hairpin-helix domain-containing protein [Flavisolibacter sp.]
MQIKKAIRSYLTYGSRDRLGVVAVISLIGIIYSFPYLFAKKNEPFPAKQTSVLVKAMDTLVAKQQSNYYAKKFDENDNDYQYQPSQTKSFAKGELFQFDPNTLSVEGWQKLGLSEKTSKTIDKYRSKGGKFYKPEDIKKIWGMPGGFYERVKDYIAIAADQNKYRQNNFEKPTYTKPEKKVLVVNINDADTSAFIALPGIGSKLASRIVNFRDKLGGFYSIEQVGETYGLPDSTFQKIKASLQLSGSVKKLNVNTATKDEFKTHPYIKWNLANAIVEYRNRHGAFKSLDELKNIALINEAMFQKILHYLSL